MPVVRFLSIEWAGRRSFWRGAAIAHTGLLLTFTAGAETTAGISSSSSAPCEYVNFIMFRDHPEFRTTVGGASDSIVNEIEDVFMRELETVGFRRAGYGEIPWLALRAVVQPSALRGDSVSGAVLLAPMADLNRDLALSLIREGVPLSGIGMLVPIEVTTEGMGLRSTSAIDLKQLAKTEAESLWSRSRPILTTLCDWRTQLADEGLTVELLYQRLVDRMAQIRSGDRQRTPNENR